ncbi:integrase [Aquibium carbonis]|uniref:Integrase n=1 Tax=Aquibium carbonis TaxID=2495581 RepID=A0A429Z3T0_9HYPH|nr:integrase [Aquibium carbonis]
MPAPRAADRRFLERHGSKWRVVVGVPRDLQEMIGKTKLKHVLPTDSLAIANQLKWKVVQSFHAEIDRHRSPQDMTVEALSFARLRRRVQEAGEDAAVIDVEIVKRAETYAGRPVGTDDSGRPIYDPAKQVVAEQFAGVAFGERTPLDTHRKTYIDQLDVKVRTLADDERAFGYLMQWCKKEGVPAFLETFGKREAVRFADDFRANAGNRSPVTLNKYILRLSMYWQWLESRGDVDLDVWKGRTYRVPRQLAEEKERPFTEPEMVKLLSGPATQHMHDLMRIAALTGARIEAIVSLRVKDCQNGTFTFKPQKREPGARDCPIHSALVKVVERRTAGKAPDDDLFPEWPPVRKEGSKRERSFKASNHFTDYRREVGVDDRQAGKRRSLVNFHSFRRWFITKAEQAGQPESTIQTVVGQKRASIAFGVYSAGPSLEQLTACVEAVRLPSAT